MELLYPCQCCGYITLMAPSPGSWLVCPTCYWQDDLDQYENPTLVRGANIHSLRVAQYNFTQIGAIDERYKSRVRMLTEKDIKDSNWKPAYKLIKQDDRQVIKLVENAFADITRPEHFTNYWHCFECFEHDETMRAAERGNLSINPNLSPLCFLSPEGFQYFMPDFVRLALQDKEAGFLQDFVTFHLVSRKSHKKGIERDRRLALFNQIQTEATLKFLEYVRQTRWIELEGVMEELEQVIEAWRYCLSNHEESA